MTVNPGWGGQPYIETPRPRSPGYASSCPRACRFRWTAASSGTAGPVAEAGATLFVAGSSIRQPDPAAAYREVAARRRRRIGAEAGTPSACGGGDRRHEPGRCHDLSRWPTAGSLAVDAALLHPPGAAGRSPPDRRARQYLLPESEIPTHWVNLLPDLATRCRRSTRRRWNRRDRRPDADLPDVADRAGGVAGADGRDPRAGPRCLQALAPHALFRAHRFERELGTGARIFTCTMAASRPPGRTSPARSPGRTPTSR